MSRRKGYLVASKVLLHFECLTSPTRIPPRPKMSQTLSRRLVCLRVTPQVYLRTVAALGSEDRGRSLISSLISFAFARLKFQNTTWSFEIKKQLTMCQFWSIDPEEDIMHPVWIREQSLPSKSRTSGSLRQPTSVSSSRNNNNGNRHEHQGMSNGVGNEQRKPTMEPCFGGRRICRQRRPGSPGHTCTRTRDADEQRGLAITFGVYHWGAQHGRDPSS